MSVFDASDKIHSRLKAQKIFYILKSLGYPVREVYKYHDYGPYSDRLAREIETAVRLGYLKEEETVRSTGNDEDPYVRYDVHITPEGTRYLQKLLREEADTQLFQATREASKQLNDKYKPSDVELIATLMYFDDVGVKGNLEDYVLRMKPRFRKGQVGWASNEVRNLREEMSFQTPESQP